MSKYPSPVPVTDLDKEALNFEYQLIHTLEGHKDKVLSLAFSPTENILASGSRYTIKLWNPITGKKIRTILNDRPPKNPDNLFSDYTARVDSLDFSVDGKILASTSESGPRGGHINFWDIETYEKIHIFRHYDIFSSTFFQDNKHFAIGSKYNIKIFDLSKIQDPEYKPRTVKVIPQIDKYESYWPDKMGISPDGSRAAYAISTGKFTIMDLTKVRGRRTKDLTHPDEDWLFTCANRVYTIKFSQDGHYLATCGEDRLVWVWDIKTYECLQRMARSYTSSDGFAFSPDGILASIYYTGEVDLLDFNTGKRIQTLKDHEGHVRSVSFSHDGNIFASGSDKSINIYKKVAVN